MTKTCPSCEILAPPDARYCRHCGTQLKRVGEASGEHISPIAATVPLSGQNTTDEIVAPHAASPSYAASHHHSNNNAHTSEVTHEELDDLLRRQRSVSTGELREAEPAGSDVQSAHARGDDGHDGLPAANHSESFRADAAHDSSPDDFDPEQTQITINVRPLTSRNLPADAAAAAVTATRANSSNPQFNSEPQQVTLSPTDSLQATEAEAAAAGTTNAPPSSPSPTATMAARSTESRALRVWLGMGVAILSIVVICGVAFAAFWYGSRGWRNTPAPPATANDTAPAPASGSRELADAKLAEADAAIASGNTSEAEARLREAAALDPLNAEPQRRLARLLLRRGAQREAIEVLRVVTRLAPADAEAWQSLASAQSAEGLHADASESYRRLSEASLAVFTRDPVQLAYADALRLSGRTSEARVIYRRLATSQDASVASASKQQLGQPTPDATDEDTEAADAHTADTAREAAAAAARAEETARTPDASSALPPTPDPSNTRTATTTTTATTTNNDAPAKASTGSPSEQYQRGVGLWATNRAAAVAEFRAAAERGNSDASYYLGLSITEGRDPRALKRADLVAALVHFGRARRSGKFRSQSATYEEQLGRELDRRRSQ